MSSVKPELVVLALNSGSSSLKFGLYRIGPSKEEVLLSGESESIGDKQSKFRAVDARGSPLIVESAPIPRATRRGVPNRLPSTGIEWPVTFSNRMAGPPALSTRSQISVISSCGDTAAATRFNSPWASS